MIINRKSNILENRDCIVHVNKFHMNLFQPNEKDR